MPAFRNEDEMASIQASKKALRKVMSEQLKKLSSDDIRAQSRRAAQLLLNTDEYKSARRLSIFLSMEGKEIETGQIVKDALSQGKQVFVPYIHKQFKDKQGPSSLMDMLALRSEQDHASLEKDKWGIPSLPDNTVAERENALGGCGVSQKEEGAAHIEAEEADLDLIVVPAVAFDDDGHRLGHGKGYYDTFFSRCNDLVRDGLMRRMPTLGSSSPHLAPFSSTAAIPVSLLISLRIVGLALHEQILSDGTIPVTEQDWTIDKIVVPDRVIQITTESR